MTQEVSAKVLINVPHSAAWDRLQDISLAHNYVPGIIKTEIVSAQSQGVGASRHVYRNKSSYIQETVEEWQRWGRISNPSPQGGESPHPRSKMHGFATPLRDCGAEKNRADHHIDI